MTDDLVAAEEKPQPIPPMPPLPAPPAGPFPPTRTQKAPGLALLLSVIFPGIGQVYNGQPAKALVFFFGLVGSIYATAEIGPFPFAFLIPFLYLYNILDAYRSADVLNARAAGGAAVAEEDALESPAWGGGLVLLGLLLLLNNLGYLNLAALRDYWPVLLIVTGGVLLYGSVRRRKDAGDAGRP
ncbi:MAG: hypothetical protein HY317_05465 [Acidobacteria bacterium]|nr:hypothetical protein [Acidobacteriota bacterium]